MLDVLQANNQIIYVIKAGKGACCRSGLQAQASFSACSMPSATRAKSTVAIMQLLIKLLCIAKTPYLMSLVLERRRGVKRDQDKQRTNAVATGMLQDRRVVPLIQTVTD